MLSKIDSYSNIGAFKLPEYISKDGIIPLCIKLPQINAFVKYFDKNTNCMNLLVPDEGLLRKYNSIWDKINNLFKNEFDSKPVQNAKYIKAEISSHNVNFYDNKTPK